MKTQVEYLKAVKEKSIKEANKICCDSDKMAKIWAEARLRAEEKMTEEELKAEKDKEKKTIEESINRFWAKLSEEATKLSENDIKNGTYINNDGVKICGKCKTPKTVYVNDKVGICPIQCECEIARISFEKAESERKNKAFRINCNKSQSNIPQKYKSVCFATSNAENNRETLKQCYDYYKNFNKHTSPNLVLHGGVGVGKTHIACCIANELLNCEKTVFFVNFGELLSNAKGYANEEEQWVLERIKSAELLIIDDFGIERDSAFAFEKLFLYMNARYESDKPFILTTNLKFSDFDKIKDIKIQRILDRIRENTETILIDGKSKRGEINNEQK